LLPVIRGVEEKNTCDIFKTREFSAKLEIDGRGDMLVLPVEKLKT
jgi:hypothetical protein